VLVVLSVSSMVVLGHFSVVDGLSLIIIVLTFVVCRFSVLASSKIFYECDSVRYFVCLVILVTVRLALTFRSRTLISLYW